MASTTSTPARTAGQTPDRWWHDAVIYQIYPRSFADGDGDGIGDLPGITSRLDHVAHLGADAVWLSPFYRSPQADAGYDVSDYRDIDPLFGTLADAEAMIDRAHELGLRVIVDLVPNHTSDEHAWFREALEAGPGSDARDRYWFRDGRRDPETGEIDPDSPPTDWVSVFGGPAWTRVRDRADAPGSAWENDPQWYLHMFDPGQPDLDWRRADVRAEFRDVLRFWLDRGVDGFRVDVAHGLVKNPELPDWSAQTDMVSGTEHAGEGALEIVRDPDGGPLRAPMFDQDGVHEIYREWRAVLEEYDHEPILVAEAWVDTPERLVKYVRPDEMHQAFNFNYLVAPWQQAEQREAIDVSLRSHASVGAPPTWVLSNHDVVRAASRLGLERTGKGPNGIFAHDPQPDAELGLRRARAAAALMLALPGGAYIYQGEELGLPEHTSLPDDVREDPAFERTNREEAGRDGARVPMPWEADAPGMGFSPTGKTWLPQPQEYARFAVDVEAGDPGSTLNWFRRALELRRELGLGRGTWEWQSDDALVALNTGAVDTEAPGEGGHQVLVMTAIDEPLDVPAGYEVLLASAPLEGVRDQDNHDQDPATDANGPRVLPRDTTVWLSRR